MTSGPTAARGEFVVGASVDQASLRSTMDTAAKILREFSDSTLAEMQLFKEGLINENALDQNLGAAGRRIEHFSMQAEDNLKRLRTTAEGELEGLFKPLTGPALADFTELNSIWQDINSTVEQGSFGRFTSELSTGVIPRIKELSAEAERLGELIGKAGERGEDFQRLGPGMEEINKKFEQLNVQLDRTNTLLDQTVTKIINRVTLAFIGLTTAAIFAFSKIEQEFTNLFIRLPEIADDARGQIENSIRDLADTAGVGVSDAIGAAILATRLGIAIEDFSDLSAEIEDLARVTGDYVGSIQAAVFAQKQFGDDAGDLSEIAGKLFVAFRDGGVTMGEISRVMGQLAPLTSSVGISFDEMIAIVTAGKQNLLSTSQTMTAMFSVIARLQNPTDELAEAFRFLGVESLPQAIQQFGGLTPFLVALQRAATELEVDFGKMIGGFRTSRVIFPLVAEEGAGVTRVLEGMTGATEELTRAGADIEGTFAFQFARFRQELGETLQLLGSGFGPALTLVVGVLEKMAEVMNSMQLPLKVVGSLIAAFTVLLIANRAILILSFGTVNLLNRALIGLALRFRTTAIASRILGTAMTTSRLQMKATEVGAISLGASLATLGVAVGILAASAVWLAFIKRNNQVRANVDELTASIEELMAASEVSPETVAFFDLFSTRLVEDDDLDLLKQLGFSIEDLVKAAEQGPEAFEALRDRIHNALVSASRDSGNFLGKFLADGGVLAGNARELDTKIGEFLDTINERIRIAADEAAVEEERLTVSGEEITEAITTITRIFGDSVPDTFYESILDMGVDLTDAVNIFDEIEAIADAKINSLLNTILTKPIEQVELNKEEMAAALANNARVIEIWLDEIQALEDKGLLRLAGNLAQLGPEFTSAFQDLASDPDLAVAANGIINQIAGGFPIEDLVATFGAGWLEAVTDPSIRKILEDAGPAEVLAYINSAVDFSNNTDAWDMLGDAMEAGFTDAVTIDQLTQTVAADNLRAIVGDLLGAAAAAGSDRAAEEGPGIGVSLLEGIKGGIGSAAQGLANTAVSAVAAAVNSMKSFLGVRSPSTLGRGIGEDLIGGIWLGILDEAAKGAGRTGKKAAKTIADGITLALREEVQNLGADFKTIFSQDRIQRSIEEAIQDINDLIERADVGIPLEIDATGFDLAEALIEGAEGIITVQEALGIERLEQQVKDLALANQQGFISDIELAAGIDDLNKARDKSIEKSDEVISLEEELVRLNEELIQTNEDIERAMEDLNQMYIDAALAIFDVVDALARIKEAGPEVLDAFRTMAEAAGIPEVAFEAMIATVQASMATYKATIESVGVKIHFDPGRNAGSSGGGGGSGGSGGSIFPVISAGKLSGTIPAPKAPSAAEIFRAAEIASQIRIAAEAAANKAAREATSGPGIRAVAHGGVLHPGELGFVGERGPEIIRGPATVLSTQNTEALFRTTRGRGDGGNVTTITVPVEIGFPVSATDARIVAETIRDAILDFEREDA